MINRRQALGLAAGAAALGLAAPAVTQGSKKVRVGYLHTLAVDGQIWIGMQRESFGKQGVELSSPVQHWPRALPGHGWR